MKNFLKTLLAVVLGVIIVNLIMFMIFGSLVSLSGTKQTIPTEGILKIPSLTLGFRKNEPLDRCSGDLGAFRLTNFVAIFLLFILC